MSEPWVSVDEVSRHRGVAKDTIGVDEWVRFGDAAESTTRDGARR